MTETVSPPAGFTLQSTPELPPTDPTYDSADPSARAAIRGETSPVQPPAGFKLVPPPPENIAPSTKDEPRPVASDVGHSLGKGAIEGAASILGMPSDIWQMLDRGYQNVMTRGAEKLGLLTSEQGAALRQPIPGAEDYEAGSAKIDQHLLGLAKAAGADISGPQTIPGQYAETIGSFVPSAVALAPGSAAKAAVRYGLIPAVTSETAGQATKGTALESYARVAGALAPEVALQGISAVNQATNPLKRTLNGVTDTQATEAQRLLDESRSGKPGAAPITVPEAIDSVTGRATNIGDVARVVEQSPVGGPIVKSFMAERPGQVEQAGRSAMDQIASTPNDPYAIAPRVQNAAQRAVASSPEGIDLGREVDNLGPTTTAEAAGDVIRPELQNIHDHREGMRNALANEDYGAARAEDYTTNGETANPVQIRPVIDHIDDQLTSAKGATATALRRARATLFSNGQPDMSVTGLSNARNAIASQVSMASRAGNTDVARVLGPGGVLGQLDSALEEVPAYGQARRNFARASEPLTPFADDTAPGRIIDQDQFGNSYTMPTEKVAPTIERGGPASADQFLSAAENSPRARQAFGQYYSQQLLGSATDARGVINPDILANTLRQNTDMLQRFPEISDNLNRIGAARRALQRVESTPLGAVSQTTGQTGQEQFAAQRSLLFNPTNALAGGERTIGNTVRAIAANDPDAARQFVRQHLEQSFNEANQSNIPGPNQFGAPKFAAAVMGNPQQAKNLEAAVRALPDGDTRWNAFNKTMNIFKAMGTRQPVGSQTAFNQQMNAWLKSHPGSLPADFAATAASPGKWFTMARDMYHDFSYGQKTGQLADAFVNGDINDLRAIVASPPRSAKAQAALVALLGHQAEPAASSQP